MSDDADREFVWETLRMASGIDNIQTTALQALDQIYDRYDDAVKEAAFYEIECSALRQEVDDAQADAKNVREALRAAWPGISGESYERPIAEVHAMVVAALGGPVPNNVAPLRDQERYS
jgi:hypothetical protein